MVDLGLDVVSNPLANAAPGSVHVGSHKVQKKTLLLGGLFFVAVAAVIVFLYYKNPKFKQMVQNVLHLKALTYTVDVADHVQFQLVPPEVRPNSSFAIIGSFLNSDGTKATVKNAYYFVYLDQNLLAQGSVGQNVSTFNTVVPTVGFINGKNYTVRVSDQALLYPPLTNANIQPPRFIPTTGTSVT